MKRSNRPQQLHNLPSSSNINWSKYEYKHYLHFDDRVRIEHVKDNIQNPDWVASHAFFPNIHFKINFKKYITNTYDTSMPINKRKQKETKTRQIYYAAHKDRFIYKYYGDLLNNAYNIYAKKNGIDDIATAYRNNKPGNNNIDYSFEVFDFLLNQEEAFVLSIDFTKFFDNINHRVLKQNIKTVLGAKELPIDWYKIFKNLTQFSYINKADIDDFLNQKYGVKKLKELQKNNKLNKIMTPKEFRVFKEEHLFKHKKPYGIPQGSGMSAVCSNVHLIHFDEEMQKLIQSYKGLYRRYCDDMILVIPVTNETEAKLSNIKSNVSSIIEKYQSIGLKVQKEKTEIRHFLKGSLIDEEGQESKLDYLGFVTDGQTVQIREKSLFKYYSRAYRKANTSYRIGKATNRKSPRKKLYKIYSHLGKNYKGRGNFISYAYRAHYKMNQLKAKSQIRNQVKRHWNKIHKKLGRRDSMMK